MTISLQDLEQDGWNLKYVPSPEQTPEMRLTAAKNARRRLRCKDSILFFISDPTYEMCLHVVLRDGTALLYTPEKMRNKHLCLKAVENDGMALKYVPLGIRDEEICTQAVGEFGMALQFVPKNLITRELAWEAILTAPAALQFVPEKMKDYDLCLKARVRDRHGRCMAFIPEHIKAEMIEI